MKLSTIFGLLALLFTAAGCPAQSQVLELNPKRLIEVIDVINGSQLGLAQKINDLASDGSGQTIDILVNSPGGSVLIGYMIADSIKSAKAKGVKVRCAVGILAASMAFNLLASCSERYALNHAALLFHPSRIYSREALTVPILLKAAEDLQRTIDNTSGEIMDMLGMDEEVFSHHFFSETMWQAQDIVAASGHKWITIVSDIKGSKLVFTPDRPNPSVDCGGGRATPNTGTPPAKHNNKPYEIIFVSPKLSTDEFGYTGTVNN